MLPPDFDVRLTDIQARIAQAAQSVGRAPTSVTLVAVTKSHPPELIRAAYAAGLRDFGENRVEELLSKREALALPNARWHWIGHLQSRKAKTLIGASALIHSVDRSSVAEELSRRAGAVGRHETVLLQVNASGEASKDGWPVTTPAEQGRFLAEVAALLALPHLTVRGLMTMAPFFDDAEATRPTFAATTAMQAQLCAVFPQHSFDILSMGMTNDFEIAIEEGATHVRVGTALFGPR